MKLSMSGTVCISLVLASSAAQSVEAAEDELASSLRAISESHGLAVARVSGDRIFIYPFGSAVVERHLKSSFLLSHFDPSGLKLVGHGYTSNNPSTFSGALILLCDNRGKPLVEVGGVINTSGIAVSPDGQMIAVVGTNTETHFQGLQVVPVRSNGAASAVPIEAKSNKLSDDITWAANSKDLAFTEGNQIRVFNTDTGKRRTLARGSKPSWSPDGSWIAFLSQDSHLVLHKISSGEEILPAKRRKSFSTAEWSPDSQWFFVAEGHNRSVSNRNCFANQRLVVYRVADLAHTEILDYCDFKPELFGWISRWPEWGL